MSEIPGNPIENRVVDEVRAFIRLYQLAVLRPGSHLAALERRISELAQQGWSDEDLSHFEKGVNFALAEAPILLSHAYLPAGAVQHLLGWPPSTL